MAASKSSRLIAAAILISGLGAAISLPASDAPAQDSSAQQKLLPVDWGDGEVSAAASRAKLRSARGDLGGLDPDKLALLELPVLAFAGTPQLVKNILGNDAKPIQPRALVMDPKQPVWYEVEDVYDGISISITADRRVNLSVSRDFQIGARSAGAIGALGTKDKPKISILDGETEKGMEGIILTYTVSRFPDIPYTVRIECEGDKRKQCRDVETIAKDQALLKVISAKGG